jgi:hypothetical protein
MRGIQWACIFFVAATLSVTCAGCRSPGDKDVPHDDPIYQNRNDVYPNRD